MRKRRFGRLEAGSVDEITLESADAAVSILSLGCVLRDWRVQGQGRTLPVVLGFPRVEDYRDHARAHGIIAGRIANRTRHGALTVEGRDYQLTRNENGHHLHGGRTGLGKRIWDMEPDSAANAVVLRYLSPDGEEGYPGTVAFTVTIRLAGPRLTYEIESVPDRLTPINLAQHAYYNLGGGGSVRDHRMEVAATRYLPLDPEQLPDGRILPVEDTRYDFRTPRSLTEADPGALGYDVTLVLDPGHDARAPAATVACDRTGLGLRLWTDQPGVQVFDANRPTIAVPGHDGEIYHPFSGLCLEAQHFPDAVHHPDWPSILHGAETPYRQRLDVEIAPE